MDIESFALNVLISLLVYNILTNSSRIISAAVLFIIGGYYTYKQVKGGRN